MPLVPASCLPPIVAVVGGTVTVVVGMSPELEDEDPPVELEPPLPDVVLCDPETVGTEDVFDGGSPPALGVVAGGSMGVVVVPVPAAALGEGALPVGVGAGLAGAAFGFGRAGLVVCGVAAWPCCFWVDGVPSGWGLVPWCKGIIQNNTRPSTSASGRMAHFNQADTRWFQWVYSPCATEYFLGNQGLPGR